jgi:hypothetical protein
MYYDRLLDAQKDLEELRDWKPGQKAAAMRWRDQWRKRTRLLDAGVPRSAIRNPASQAAKESAILRLQWLRRANALLNGIEKKDIAGALRKAPDLLSDLLHAFDRSDETYFLYLFHEVVHIRHWLKEFEEHSEVPPSGAEPDDKDPAPARVQQAEPWAGPDSRRWDVLGARIERDLGKAESLDDNDPGKQAARASRLEDRRRLELTKKVTAWYSIDERESIEKWYRSISTADSEMERSGRIWGPQYGGPQEPSIERLVTCVLCPEIVSPRIVQGESPARPGSGDERLIVEQHLLERLIASPKEQSDLALLLGKLPSEWLRWEERPYVEQRRRLLGAMAEDNIDPVGLCFSGGGIRSATFNLGVLQALSELNLLRHIDYLSTVSGGGYVHQWFAAWVLRSTGNAQALGERAGIVATDSLEVVQKALVPQPCSTLPQIEATQVTFLRRFSNYLTPTTGILSADVWTMLAIWARNTFLNQMILIAGLLCFFALLRTALTLLPKLCDHANGLAIACVLFYLFSTGIVAVRMLDLGRQLEGKTSKLWAQFRRNLWPILSAVALLLSSVTFASLWMCRGVAFGWTTVSWTLDWTSFWNLCHCVRQDTPGGLLVAVAALWHGISGSIAFASKRYQASNPDAHPAWTYLKICLTGMISGVVVFWVFGYLANRLFLQPDSFWATTIRGSKNASVMDFVDYLSKSQVQHDLFLLLLPPALLAAHFLVSVLHVGLNRRVFRDEVLEWLARYRAWGFLVSLAWVGMFGMMVIALPLWQKLLTVTAAKWWGAATAIWTFISAGGALSARAEPGEQWKQIARQVLLAVAPYVFIAGILLAVCVVVCAVANPDSESVNSPLLYLLVISAIVCVVFGKTVDINEFSMYAFYRNRLARCYQGASVIDRTPDPFTGFSEDDREVSLGDLRVPLPDELAIYSPWVRRSPTGGAPDPQLETIEQKDLRPAGGSKRVYMGPIPIFCCTANFTSGEDLAQQERKGASFAYTAINSGYDIPWTGVDLGDKERELFYNGFRDTLDLGHPAGPGLADVCAASGAAASSLSGYRTTPALAFLMTFFNARLGVWKRNTRYLMRTAEKRQSNAPSDESQSPTFALVHMFMELFGHVSAKDKFLYLSDGGFFDNMGLYELVRRRCRNIILCDAEEDGELAFGGLSMALRRCRSDFGVEIDLDPRAIRKQPGSEFSSTHCVVGTILYPNDDPKTPRRQRGKIVYLKSSLTGSEPADLLGYRLQHPAFPHDSTGNQWFSESEFESYRVLGRYIALDSLRPACSAIQDGRDLLSTAKRDAFYSRLYDIWHPVKPSIEKHLGSHTKNLADLLAELRTNNDRASRIVELFKQDRDWSTVAAEDQSYFEAFAFSLFEFIWRVYNDLDLHLESNREHPHGEIWINTFRHWFKMPFMKLAWNNYRGRYPASFRYFVDECLN